MTVVQHAKQLTCNLCKKNKTLIKKSHIIPDFMYRELYDKKHKIRAFSPQERAKGEGYVNKPSTGEYEGGILYADFDNDLLGSKYEDYARKAIYGGRLPENENPVCENFKNQHGVHFTTCQNISYPKFKIFLLSILWRASISSRPFFSDINLGPHEEIIRKMIYPGKCRHFPPFGPKLSLCFFRPNFLNGLCVYHLSDGTLKKTLKFEG